MTAELLQQQRELWRKALFTAGITNHELDKALSIAEMIFTELEMSDDEYTEHVLGFGDYTRGMATRMTAMYFRLLKDM